MLKSFPMNGFVPTKNPAKARAFYEGVLGFELIGDNEYVATYRSGANKIMLQQGTPFDPLQRAAPDVNAPLEERQVGGLGVMPVKRLMDGVTYARRDGKNVLTIRKRA